MGKRVLGFIQAKKIFANVFVTPRAWQYFYSNRKKIILKILWINLLKKKLVMMSGGRK